MPLWAIRQEGWCKARHLHWWWCCIAVMGAPKSHCKPSPQGESVAGGCGELLLDPSVGGGSTGGMGMSWAGGTCAFSDQLDKEILLWDWGWERVGKGMKLCVLLVHGMKSIFAFCPLTRPWKWSGKACIYSKRWLLGLNAYSLPGEMTANDSSSI